jgi:transcriptional regulator
MSLYVPDHFAADEREAFARLVRDHPFATLVTPGGDEPTISHVPMLLDADGAPFGTLIGHVARANPHARRADARSIAIFHGPHAYVSPSLYVEPAAAVPTWNYAVAHAHGVIELQDVAATHAIVERLVERFESPRSAPWRIGLDARRLEAMLRAIVGFRIRVARVEVKLKLSQNRSREDRLRVAAALAGEGYAEAAATAEWMRLFASPDADR